MKIASPKIEPFRKKLILEMYVPVENILLSSQLEKKAFFTFLSFTV